VIWCDMMWCDVIWCDVMLCYVMWCDVMWYNVMWSNVMWRDVMWCYVMLCDVMWYDVILCDMMWCDVMLCDVMWCDMMWCTVMWCDVRYSEVMWGLEDCSEEKKNRGDGYMTKLRHTDRRQMRSGAVYCDIYFIVNCILTSPLLPSTSSPNRPVELHAGESWWLILPSLVCLSLVCLSRSVWLIATLYPSW
jgi:hypothetical protein